MADYKKMYQIMLKASECAINTLIEAQRAAEEYYISAPEADIKVLPLDGQINHENTEDSNLNDH